MGKVKFETGLPKTGARWAWVGVRAVVVLAWFSTALIGVATGAAIIAFPNGFSPSPSVALTTIGGLATIAVAIVLLTRMSRRDDEIGLGAKVVRRWMLLMPLLAAMLAGFIATSNHPPLL